MYVHATHLYLSMFSNLRLFSVLLQVAQWTWYYIIAGELSSDYTMHANELPPSRHTKPRTEILKSLAFTYTLDGQVSNAMIFTDILLFPATKTTDFHYWNLAPILNNGWALLGELNKIIPVSETRITNILNVGMDYLVSVTGVEGEKVSITAYDTASSQAVVYACTISPSGQNILYLPGGPCVAA